MLELPCADKVTACCDECGRGSLIYDVVAAAVIMPSEIPPGCEKWMGEINDSKKLSPKKRKRLSDLIKQYAIAWSVGTASCEEIDKYNILHANHKAMHRALDCVWNQHKFDMIHVDGDRFEPWLCPSGETDWLQFECIIDGDSIKLGIAAASILAKVHRDEAINDLCDKYPDLDEKYKLRKNKGYGTKQHMDGLKEFGPSIFHRKSFAPVSRALKS